MREIDFRYCKVSFVSGFGFRSHREEMNKLTTLSACLLSMILASACVEEEDIFAYEYDPERLCLTDPDSPIKVATRKVQKVHKGPQVLILPKTCSINEERRLVSFQSYYTEEFVDCYPVWEEVVYWEEVPGRTSISDLKCED